MSASRFGVVGTGWRAQFFLRLAALLPDRLEVAGIVVHSPESARRTAATWKLPIFEDIDALLAAGPVDFVISSVTWEANPGVVTELVKRGVRVLSETPPAPDVEGLRELWAEVGSSGLVQVAEQYLMLPGHAARKAVVAGGAIGRPTSVQVSSTHGYHAVSMIRGLLGNPYQATVSAQTFSAPLVDPISRDGWTDDNTEKQAVTTLATLDFGDGRMGVYDFTDNQWHNPLRSRRIVVRGTQGELVDDEVVRLAGEHTILRTRVERRQVGYDLDLDGYDTDHISFDGQVVWRNEFFGKRLADEEIAIATLLVRTAAWARGEGPEPYPLAEACEDQMISLAIDASLAQGGPVLTTTEAWARD